MDRIVIDPEIRSGKPCIANTQITVHSILKLLDEGLTFKEIIQDRHPNLTVEDIRACIQYAIAAVATEATHHTAIRSEVEDELRSEYNLPQLLKDGAFGKYATEYPKGVTAEMNESVIPTVIEQMMMLPDDAQRQVLEFLQTLRATIQQGTPGKQLLQFAGMIKADDLTLMRQAIEHNCEQIDANEW